MYQVMVLISNRAYGYSNFNEVFVDLPGYYDPDSVLKILTEVGFKGMIMQGHVPKIIGN